MNLQNGKKIEECLPRDDEDIDTGKRFLNYEDPDWSKEDFEWVKNEDGTQIKIQSIRHNDPATNCRRVFYFFNFPK